MEGEDIATLRIKRDLGRELEIRQYETGASAELRQEGEKWVAWRNGGSADESAEEVWQHGERVEIKSGIFGAGEQAAETETTIAFDE